MPISRNHQECLSLPLAIILLLWWSGSLILVFTCDAEVKPTDYELYILKVGNLVTDRNIKTRQILFSKLMFYSVSDSQILPHTHPMAQSLCWEVNSHSASQEMPPPVEHGGSFIVFTTSHRISLSSILILSSPLHLGLPSALFPLGLSTYKFCAFLISLSKTRVINYMDF